MSNQRTTLQHTVNIASSGTPNPAYLEPSYLDPILPAPTAPATSAHTLASPTRPIPAPFAFVADLIIKNGEPYFLELGDLHSSGLDGYNALHGGNLHEVIESHLDQITHPRAGDDNITLQSICDDKGLFYALFAHQCPTLFPLSRIYPFYKLSDQISAIAHDFTGHKNIVLKQRDLARGEGVCMLPVQTLMQNCPQDVLENFSLPQQNPLHFNSCARHFTRFAGQAVTSGYFVAQSLIEADPIMAFGHSYAPVMRVAITAEPVNHGEGQKLKLHHHGAYYKLPATPLERAQTLLEKHLSKMDDQAPSQSVAPVDGALYQHIQNRLEEAFLPALEHAFYQTPLTHVHDLIQAPDTGSRMAALAFLTRHRKFDVLPDEAIDQPLINKIDNFIDTNPAALHFMAIRANRTKQWHAALRPLQERYKDLLIELPDGTSALSARYLHPYSDFTY